VSVRVRGDRERIAANYRGARVYLLLAVFLLAGTSLYMIADEGVQVWRSARMNLMNLSRGFEASVGVLLQQPIARLEAIAVEAAGPTPPPHDRVVAILSDAMRFAPVADYLGLCTAAHEADGVVVDSRGREVPADVLDSLKDSVGHPQRTGLELRQLIQLPHDPEWYLPVILGIPRVKGEPDLAFALVPARRLISGTQSMRLFPESLMSLVTSDGTRLLGYVKSRDASAAASVVELPLPSGGDPINLQREHEDLLEVNGAPLTPRTMKLMAGQMSGSFQSSSTTSGAAYLAGYARSARLPLYVAVVTGTGPLYAAWARQAAAPAIVLGVGALAVLVFALQLHRALGRQEAYIREQEATTERLLQLAALERRWADAFNNAAFGIAISDTQTETLAVVNPAWASMHGMTVAEVEGRTITSLYAPDEQPRLPQLREQVDREGHVSFEAKRVRSDGTTFPVQMEVTSVRGPEGGVAYRVSSAIDITERKRTEEVLRQAQKMEAVGNISGGMAHDFNNLLGVIIGNLDLALSSPPEEHGPLMQEALAAARRGADLTRRLLAFARRQPLRPESVQPNDLIAGMAQLLTRVLGEHIEVVLDLAPDLWPVRVDPAQLESSIANLATNSRDAMPRGGKLTIRTANLSLGTQIAGADGDLLPAGDYVMVEVTDTGSGMTPEVMRKIFEPFFTTKEPGRGTGLGLSMVFGFAKQSGGQITVHSEPGSYATFRLYLPRATTPAGVAQPPARARESGRGESVLVVEDNPELRRVAVRQLAALGYRVIEAPNAAAALAELEKSDPVQLLFSDVVMAGGMDGFELAREAARRAPGIKVLLTSGFPDREHNAAPREDSTRLLDKPYDSETLARAVRDALDA